MQLVPYNQNNTIEYFMLVDASGVPKTGVVHTDVTGSYVRQQGARVSISMSALAAVTTAFTAGGWKEIDATNMPGLYRVDIPDATFIYADGIRTVCVELKGTIFQTVVKEYQLVTPASSSGSIGATVNSQPTYTEYTFKDGTVRKDWI